MSFTKNSYDKLNNLNVGKIAMIRQWLQNHAVCNYIINDDLSIDVNENVNFWKGRLEGFEIPIFIQFNLVKGFFNVNKNNLTTLRGCPKKVLQWFSCEENNLENLDYAPKFIEQGFYGNLNNKITEDMCRKYINSSTIRGSFHTDSYNVDNNRRIFPNMF